MNRNYEKPQYGNWVSINMIKMLSAGFLMLAGISIACFSPLAEGWPVIPVWVVRSVLLILTAAFLSLSLYFAACRSLLSYDGKHKVQSMVLDFVLSHFDFNQGRILDIGCGNGALSIKTAKKFPLSQVTGVDYWGPVWNYAKEQCEKNAQLEGVDDRVSFRKGDAAKLDFPDEFFDGAISNFVFHEVKSQPDKRLVVREALRVVKKGGVFAFHDLFLEERFYGDMEDFIAELKKDGISRIIFLPSEKELSVPGLLRAGFMLGKIGLLYGTK